MTYIQSRPGRKSRWTRGGRARNKVPVILPEGFCDSRLRMCVWRFFLSPIAFLFVSGAGVSVAAFWAPPEVMSYWT